MKLAKPRVLCDRHGIFFPVRVINSWNSLPDNFVSSSSVMGFKADVIGGSSRIQSASACRLR